MLLQLAVLLSVLCSATAQTEELRQPYKIPLNNAHATIHADYKNFVLRDANGNLVANFTTRVFCWNGNCTLPGPTWELHPGTWANVTLCNNMIGSPKTDPDGQAAGYIQLKDQDVVNFHTHGLHVNPHVDDIVDLWVDPKPDASATEKCRLYPYWIPDYHYPGSHWYHAHWPGSVTITVGGGMFGAMEVLQTPTNATDFPLNMTSSWFELFFFRLVDGRECNNSCDTIAANVPFQYMNLNKSTTREVFARTERKGFPILSNCFLYCTTANRTSGIYPSVFETQVNTPGGYMLLTNGQYQPKKTIAPGEWNHFRFLDVAQVYMFVNIDANETECDLYLLGFDGVYVSGGIQAARNMHQAPYFGTVVIPIGGRVDLAVRCHITNTNYTIRALSIDPSNPATTNSAHFSANNKAALAEIFEEASDCLKSKPTKFYSPTPPNDMIIATIEVRGNETGSTPGTPEPGFHSLQPHSTCPYLKDTTTVSLFTTATTTATKSQFAMNTEGQVLPMRPHSPTGLNNIVFSTPDSLFNFTTGNGIVHQWTVFIRFHPFHHHTWPFQVQFDFPQYTDDTATGAQSINNGWWVKAGDWRDVMGLYGSLVVRVNYVAGGRQEHDILNSKLVTHCHFVYHEDLGMMAWFGMTTNKTSKRTYTYPTRYKNSTNDSSRCFIRPLRTSGGTWVISKDLGGEFAMAFADYGANCYSAILFGKSRPNVDTFFVNYGVTDVPTSSCVAADGFAVRLQVYRNTQNTISGTGVLVNISSPNPAINMTTFGGNFWCGSFMYEWNDPDQISFSFNITCFLTAPNPTTTDLTLLSVQRIAEQLNANSTRQLNFSWGYGDGIGTTAFPTYTALNVAGCPFTAEFRGNNVTTLWKCVFGYFNLVNSTRETFSLFPNNSINAPVPNPTAMPTGAPTAKPVGSGASRVVTFGGWVAVLMIVMMMAGIV